MSLGKQIAQLRKAKKIRSIDLADKVGVKQPYISAIENDKKVPSLDVLIKIASVLGVTTSELLGEAPVEIPAGLKRLVETAKNLSEAQLQSIVSMVEELTDGYRKGHSKF
jgi:transcriptional regulator with XRE-family HTH domain